MSQLNNENFTLIVRKGLRSAVQAVDTYSSQAELGYTTNSKQLYVSDGTIFQPVQTLEMAVVNNGEVITNRDEIIYIF